MRTILPGIALCVLTACGNVDLEWREEVALMDGRLVMVERTAKGKADRPFGGTGGWEASEMTLTVLPESNTARRPPAWKSKYVPILLDHQASSQTWSVVATFYFCSEWQALGKPASPYLEFQSVNGKAWTRVPLEARLYGRKANLLSGPRSSGEPRLVSRAEKDKRNRRAADEYREITRVWRTNC